MSRSAVMAWNAIDAATTSNEILTSMSIVIEESTRQADLGDSLPSSGSWSGPGYQAAAEGFTARSRQNLQIADLLFDAGAALRRGLEEMHYAAVALLAQAEAAEDAGCIVEDGWTVRARNAADDDAQVKVATWQQVISRYLHQLEQADRTTSLDVQRVLLEAAPSLGPHLVSDGGGYTLQLKSKGEHGPDTSDIGPRDVAALLRECFNCYFPVEGAPKEFPDVGDELPLVIDIPDGMGPMQAPVRVTEVVETDDDFSFEFVGLENHFDGEGSTVRFHFWNDTEQLRLNVYANTTDAPVPDYFNARVAEIVWGRFLGNVVSASAY
ncbi:hypothetical protein [Gordonia aquimaris]|uniref:Uncharacterized protein n=1 Tax=Gordonia aquimaris TaxID=2984863 RepID=A0A9X3D8P4_9ACTN|nr:hypothetical protein [Gordonia aquimaris]MCX2965692.1 hypothetical protein [Gordonia aquimaris]